jgi:hypothetical protein
MTCKKARTAIKRQWPALMIAALLFGCAHPEDSSFGVQAARRGENCNAIATGSAMDAYGHGVGPAENVYQDVKRDCLAWQQRERERLDAPKNK